MAPAHTHPTTAPERPTVTVTTIESKSSLTMPPGTYWVGDPCYTVLDHARWSAWLNATYAASNTPDDPNAGDVLLAVMEPPAGSEVAPGVALGFATHGGDGCYEDKEGNEYPVDAGLIGLVPVELADDETAERLCRKVTFTSPFTCSRSENRSSATLSFGHIVITT